MTATPPSPSPPTRRRLQVVLWVLMVLIVAVVAIVAISGDAARLLGLQADQGVQVGYFVIILIFVGSAFLGRGLSGGEVLRATVGWLAIFLLLVGGYVYRQELADVGGRLLGALAPGVPISGRLTGEANGAVVVVRSLDGHFGVRAELDDVPLSMMVDTGASFVTLTTTDAAAVGVSTRGLNFSVPIHTANGVINAAPVTIDRVKVGTIERRGVPALVAPPASLDQSLLGMSFLNTLKGYAIAGDRLVLSP